MAFMGVIMILINSISSFIWSVWHYSNVFSALIGMSVIFMNGLLLVGIGKYGLFALEYTVKEPNPDSLGTMHSTKRVRIGLFHCVQV